MAQIQINNLHIHVKENTQLSEIPEFRQMLEKSRQKSENPKVWLRRVGSESAEALSPDTEGVFIEKVENGDSIEVVEISKYGK